MSTLLEDEQLELPGIGYDRFVRYHELKDYGIPFSRQHLTTLEEQGQFPRAGQLVASGDRLAAVASFGTGWRSGAGSNRPCACRRRSRSTRPTLGRALLGDPDHEVRRTSCAGAPRAASS